MPRTLPTPRLTPRDVEILVGLARCPLTILQLLTLSQTFTPPFTTARRLRERMQALVESGRVQRYTYLTAGRGALSYYTLSRLGYRLIHGHKAALPPASAFGPVAVARQHHTQALADFVVHTAVAAHGSGIAFTGFYGENRLRLAVGADILFPDCAFQLVPPGAMPFRFFVELDNSTERVRSAEDLADSWQRKLRLYNALQDGSPQRFRLLIVSTARGERLPHILSLAAEVNRNPKRALVYGIRLPEYLETADALQARCFLNHWHKRCALLPRQDQDGSMVPSAPAAALARAGRLW